MAASECSTVFNTVCVVCERCASLQTCLAVLWTQSSIMKPSLMKCPELSDKQTRSVYRSERSTGPFLLSCPPPETGYTPTPSMCTVVKTLNHTRYTREHYKVSYCSGLSDYLSTSLAFTHIPTCTSTHTHTHTHTRYPCVSIYIELTISIS